MLPSKEVRQTLVTIVEQVMSFTVTAHINGKSAANVTQATIALLKPYKEVVHTVTADNGKEFAYHEKISKALGAKVYFVRPCSSWARGLNESMRPHFPKDTDFKTVTKRQ